VEPALASEGKQLRADPLDHHECSSQEVGVDAEPGGILNIPGPRSVLNKLNKSFVFKGSLTVVDQGVVSGARFITLILLARYLTPGEYGGLVMAYGVTLLVTYVQMAYILLPMSILGPPLAKDEEREFYGILLKIQVGLALLLSLSLMATSGFWAYLFKEPSLTSVYFAMGVSVFFIQIQEFFRRFFYNKGDVGKALLNDAICYLGQFAGVLVFIWLRQLTSTIVFCIIAAACLLSSGWALAASHKVFSLTAKNYKEVFQNLWALGKWLLVSMIAQWVSGQIYVYVVASYLNISMAGVLGACRNIFGIINVALTGLRNFVLPYGAKRYASQGIPFLKKFLTSLYLWGAVPVFGVAVLISVFSGSILDLLYGGKYQGFGYVVVVFALNSLINFFVFPPETGLFLMRRTESILRSNFISAVIGLIAAIPLIRFFGIGGALSGMILTQVALVAGMTVIFQGKVVQTEKE
jgi:O-antigen/teichoic acid export membrane protein